MNKRLPSEGRKIPMFGVVHALKREFGCLSCAIHANRSRGDGKQFDFCYKIVKVWYILPDSVVLATDFHSFNSNLTLVGL